MKDQAMRIEKSNHQIHSSAAPLLLLCLNLIGLPMLAHAEPSVGPIARVQGNFGSVFNSGLPSAPRGYLDTSIRIEPQTKNVVSIDDGEVVFIQNASRLNPLLPHALGSIVALSHENGLVSITSGILLSPDLSLGAKVLKGSVIGELLGSGGSEKASYFLRILDTRKNLWINPVLFVPHIQDGGSPKIEKLTLRSSAATIQYSSTARGRTRVPQGSQRLYAKVSEMVRTNSVSGVFHYRVLLNGQIVIDKKLDSARATDKGMAFLGSPPPSEDLVDRDESIALGDITLVRGLHTIELIVSDYSGNQSNVLWAISVE
jgi:hypothetical protein